MVSNDFPTDLLTNDSFLSQNEGSISHLHSSAGLLDLTQTSLTPDIVDFADKLSAKLPYQKFFPPHNEATRSALQNASGEIDYGLTNNYIFQALLQEDNDSLKYLICAILHLNPKSVHSIVVTNPITLGKYVEAKTFILDIKVLMNDHTIINLEMQINNYKDWPERSLAYLCRSFDNLNKGKEYVDVKTAIHISFLDFSLFPDAPEFHAVYKLQNVKNQKIYTDKFMLHVIELNQIHLAAKEDKDFFIDKWASLFKANTWEDIRMLVDQTPTLQSAAETLYQMNMSEQFRETCDRFIRAEQLENALRKQNERFAVENEALRSEISMLAQSNTSLSEENSILTQNNSALTAEIARLQAIIAAQENSN